MEITLAELQKKVEETEAKIHESPETLKMLTDAADTLKTMVKDSKNIAVLTDYDADGLTSGYIMKKTIETLNPDCIATVQPNDRRGHYGLGTDTIRHTASMMKDDEIDNVIVLDMGSNQIPEIEANDTFNNHILVIDHHLIESSEVRDKILSDPAYCNCHAISDNDRDNAQYCTAGLAYRLYELTGCKELADEKQNNTVLAIAAIGTAADMVDVLDENSFNRKILKEGIKAVDEASPENFDYVIGYMLSKVKVSENTTAHELAFNAGAFLNSGGRMSEVIEENGAARTFAALTADNDKASTYREIDRLQFINSQRKSLIADITASPEYVQQLEREKYGENRENNIAVITLPPDTPHSFAGLVAGKFQEATDKAVICLSQNTKTGNWSGSGRNPESNETSLMDFMKNALEGTGIDIKYGGHSDAIGVSQLKDIEGFMQAINDNMDKMVRKDRDETFTIPVSEFNAPDALDKVKALEPLGTGFQIPSVKLEGTEIYRDKLFKSGKKEWKTVRVNQEGVKYDVADWSYDEKSYLQSGAKGNEIEVTARVGLSSYGGEHIEFTASFDRNAYLERAKELNVPPYVPEVAEQAEKADISPN